MAAYYNEIDKFAAQYLRNLIKAGHIAPGDVDERSIEDVPPSDLAGYTQCHFFAGIGVWSYALRQAGWPDDRPIWTGSCPCQPFSAAGKSAGFADQRHLWPDWEWLIAYCRPAKVVGEQVASKPAGPWIDLVFDDLEALGYACGAVAFPSAGVGASHIRDRLYWVADAASEGLEGRQQPGQRDAPQLTSTQRDGAVVGLAHAGQKRIRTEGLGTSGGPSGGVFSEAQQRSGVWPDVGPGSAPVRGMADTQLQQRQDGQTGIGIEHDAARRLESAAEAAGLRRNLRAGPINGYWADADWLFCRDGKWRPVEPGTFPLAHGATSRVGRLRAYGNAINAQAAKTFIEALMAAEK